MIPPPLHDLLQPVIRRHHAWQVARGLALCWTFFALAALGLLGLKHALGWESGLAFRAVPALAALTALILWLACRRSVPDSRWLAGQIERDHPELNSLLLAAVEQHPDEQGRYGYLQQKVIARAIEHAVNSGWADQFAVTRLRWTRRANLLTLLALVTLVSLHRAPARPQPARAALAATATTITVNPGHALVEKGSSLVVMARFDGPTPAGANLVVGANTDSPRIIPLVKSLDDPIFGTTLVEVGAAFDYHVTFDSGRSEDYMVKVFEYPRLTRADAVIQFPAYTGLEEKRLPNTRRVTAVEQSKVGLELELNKPVASAALVSGDRRIELRTDPARSVATLTGFTLTENAQFELQLRDAEGRTNKVESRFVFVALQNRPPEIKFLAPKGDQRVSALQELLFQAEGADDFGLKGFGVGYRVAGRLPMELSLATNSAPNEKITREHLVRLEDLGVVPDNLISYYLWAEDAGPEGETRRVESDIYFAEVRRFDEIFRPDQQAQAQSRSQSQGEGGNPSEQLAELQKEIISATWKLRRQRYVASGKPAPATP